MALPKLDLDSLSTADRLELIEAIWDSLEAEGLPPEQLDELERRLDDMERNPGGNIPWAEARGQIEARKR
jgi:putative addiction module component (TIGR02574 family)